MTQLCDWPLIRRFARRREVAVIKELAGVMTNPPAHVREQIGNAPDRVPRAAISGRSWLGASSTIGSSLKPSSPMVRTLSTTRARIGTSNGALRHFCDERAVEPPAAEKSPDVGNRHAVAGL
jgi:hypothetical protein